MSEIRVSKDINKNSFGGVTRDFEVDKTKGTLETSLNASMRQSERYPRPTIILNLGSEVIKLDTSAIKAGLGTIPEVNKQLEDPEVAKVIAGVGYNMVAVDRSDLETVPLPQAPDVSWNDIRILN